MDGIYDSFYPNTEFTVEELKSALRLNQKEFNFASSGILFHWANRNFLKKKKYPKASKGKRLKFQMNTTAFKLYRESLNANLDSQCK